MAWVAPNDLAMCETDMVCMARPLLANTQIGKRAHTCLRSGRQLIKLGPV